MKKLVIVFILTSSSIFAQIDITGGMGINMVYSSSFTDYVNNNFAQADPLPSFKSTGEFFIEADYTLKQNFQIGMEYSFSLFSYNTPLLGGSYEISYTHYKPSLLAYYVISGEGYKIKFGGGIGYRYVSLDERILGATNYSTSGFGLLLRMQGHTLLSGNLYANIGGDLRNDFLGEIQNSNNGQNYNLNSLSAGIRLGISYSF
ncbi:hypothetical protein BMS3Abin04_01194 [bacterium BMS3Abin04]|nr:hypothetical protein BMS3Abin04_01194 [bacterium BMS3Abin04]